MKHIEVQKLVEWGNSYGCKIKENGTARDNLILVDFLFDGAHYCIYIDDEYKDFNEENQPLCLYLVLRSIIDYKEEDDFLKWCNLYSLNASDNQWLNYYRSLSSIVQNIEKEGGEIQGYISDLDYQLRSGAFYELANLPR